MAELTFRDFAGAIMQGNVPAAATVLETLLGLDPAGATRAAQFFQTQAQAAGPAFMGKAMGLRTAVASGSEPDTAALLRDCFGLEDPQLAAAVTTLLKR